MLCGAPFPRSTPHFKFQKLAGTAWLRPMPAKTSDPARISPPRRRIITAIASGCASAFIAPGRTR